ncbi:AAA family ATPase, partial [Acinetobacter baumannii]
MKSIKINSIKFDKIGFRKLANLDIKISPRITIIAGHNGIGKSSILGLLANGSSDKKHVSYFEKSFRAEFNEIFHLDPD